MATVTKKPAQRNLPHNTKYTFVRAFYTGGIENGCQCDNCGKMLSNVAVVKDDNGKQYNVGLDCAITLSTVNPFEFEHAKYLFSEAKKLRAAINKKKKEFGDKFFLKTEEFIDTYNDNTPTVSVQGFVKKERFDDRYFTYYFKDEVFEQLIKPLIE